jgi:hypothetical protein
MRRIMLPALALMSLIHYFMFSMHETSVAVPQDDLMDIDQVEPQVPPSSLLSAAGIMNPLSILDPNFRRRFLDGSSDLTNRGPFVTHPREVREIPIEVKDGNQPSSHSGQAPAIEDVTGTVHAGGPDIHGTVLIDDDEDEDISAASTAQARLWDGGKDHILGDGSHGGNVRPNAPEFESLPDYSNDIEEEMVRAAIEASKWELEAAQNVCDTNLQCL